MRWHRIDLKWCKIPLRGKFNFSQFKWCSDHYKITNSIWNFELSVHLPFVVSETSPVVCYSAFNSVYWLLDSTSGLKGKKGKKGKNELWVLTTDDILLCFYANPAVNKLFSIGDPAARNSSYESERQRPCAFTTLPKCVCLTTLWYQLLLRFHNEKKKIKIARPFSFAIAVLFGNRSKKDIQDCHIF